MNIRRTMACAVVVGALLLSGCSTSTSTARTEVDCVALLDRAIAHERGESTIGDTNEFFAYFNEHCGDEFDIAVQYGSLLRDNDPDYPCDELRKFNIHPDAIDLVEADGMCDSSATALPDLDFNGGTDTGADWRDAGQTWPDGGIGWDEARNYVGSYQNVCGPLKSIRETEWGTFVNIGRDYPSVDRFSFVLWDWYGVSMPAGATVCAAGDIYLYEGVTQMELYDGNQLRYYEQSSWRDGLGQ